MPDDATEPVGVMGEDGLVLSVALSGLRIAQVEGRFDAQDLALEDTVTLDRIGALQSLDVGWTSLDVGLVLHNTTGLDFSGALQGLARLDSAGGDPSWTALEDPVLGAPVFLPRAMVSGAQMAGWSIQPTAAELSLSAGSGNLSGFLGSLPEAIALSVGLGVNPLGDVTGGMDRIDFEQPELETVIAPLSVASAARCSWTPSRSCRPSGWTSWGG